MTAQGAIQWRSALTGEALAELLTVLAEAPESAAASQLLLGRLAELAGATRAILLTIDASRTLLTSQSAVGWESPTHISIPLSDDEHPVVVSAVGLEAVTCHGDALRRDGIPFTGWFAVALPQTLLARLPTRYRDSGASFPARFRDCETVSIASDQRRRAGLSPFGVALIEGEPSLSLIEVLAEIGSVAGPVLARLFTVEELKRSAERLDQTSNLLTAVITALPDPVIITDARNEIVVANRRADQLLTAGDESSEGRRRAVEINNLLFNAFLTKAVLTGGLMEGARELNLVDPEEGTDLLFEVLTHPLSSAVAKKGSFLSVLRDVTDLKRATGELERQFKRLRHTEQSATRERDRLNLILKSVGDPILVTDQRANIILMNAQAESLFELSEEALKDRTIAHRVRGNDTRITALVAEFAISPERSHRARTTLLHPETGDQLPVEVVAGKILNERGEALAIVSVLHDLTRQVENERLYEELKGFSAELERRVQEATKDLAEQNRRLQWQSQELEKAYRLKSEFLANMSHELRTPINALIGYTALMLDRIYGDLTPKQEEGLRRIQSSSQHLLALINDILDLAKIEAGKMPVHLETVSLLTVVSEVAGQIEPLAHRKGLELTVDVAADVPDMVTDRTKVRQIVLNLLSNAVKFTQRGAASVTARLAGDNRVEIAVHDTGIGIRAEDLEVIFEEFRQVDQSRTREYGGTGLGLSITRKLIALLGGEISVSSQYGVGTTFTVLLPLHGQLMTTEEQVARVALASTPSPPS